MENELKAEILLILISIAVGLFAFRSLPPEMAVHWDMSGQPDGFLPDAKGAFLGPGIMTLLFASFMLMLLIDPFRANINTFRTLYYRFLLGITSFIFVLYIQSILWNLGTQISFNLTLPILLGCLLFYFGALFEKAKRNWFIGIATPWTLSSEEVWDKTHQTAGMVFKVIGLLTALTAFVSMYAFLLAIGLLVAAVVGLIAYSAVEYVKIMDEKEKKVRKRLPKG